MRRETPLTNHHRSHRLPKTQTTSRFQRLRRRNLFMAGKGDVINEIAEQAGISKKEAAAAFDAFVGYIAETCQRGERCAIPGLGSFAVSQRKAREGRNPRTNEKITIPASKNVRFKAGKDLKESVNAPKRGAKGKK